MKNLYKTLRWSILSMSMLAVCSCSDSLDETNVSSNTLPEDKIDIRFVLTNVLTSTAKNDVDTNYKAREVSAGSQYLQRDNVDFYSFYFVWDTKNFNSFFPILTNSQYIYDRAEAEKEGDEKKYYQAVSLIMKSYTYGFLTSTFGDIPYSEAIKGEERGDAFVPKYDAQEDIFLGILSDLSTANDMLKGVGTIGIASNADVVFQGDGQKWRKFANSLRLRYCMRLSEKTLSGLDPSAEIASIVNNPTENPIMTDISDNAEVKWIGSASDNSFPGGPLSYTFRSEFYRRKPSATIVKDLIELNDPRLTTWIRPVDVQIFPGATDGVELVDGRVRRNTTVDIAARNADSDLTNDVNTSLFVGLGVALSAPNDYNMGNTVTDVRSGITALDPDIYLGDSSNPHISYLTNIYSENANELSATMFMSSAETQFILAEASERGWIGGNPMDYYLTGIEKSFDRWQIADGASSAVYDEGSNSLVAFDKAAYMANAQAIYTNATDKLAPIMHQKWIAGWLTAEAWFDWRRTGLPELEKNVIQGAQGQDIPKRQILSDPFNEDNLTQATGRLQPAVNDQWSLMWLLQ